MPARRHQRLLAVGHSEQRYLKNGLVYFFRSKSDEYANKSNSNPTQLSSSCHVNMNARTQRCLNAYLDYLQIDAYEVSGDIVHDR